MSLVNYTQITSSQQISSRPGFLSAIFVSAASATPTIKIWDSLTAANAVLIDTFTPVAGQTYLFPDIAFGVGLFVTISGTVSCTVCAGK